ncbi:hypothetical protein EG68_06599 [Paragonimus skrjabini miyazakii]|uniref:Uncharacterized protein n=1 Tax=Paragonimus skrjabini miyazakii TaxID=59628 RepID=A0A8S9YTG8_9TREM|nr:hypothetical protein EG68_06599 [Paragonimus skrjabini miyazakii]
MRAWTIVLCFLFESEGNVTFLDHKKTLCIFNAIRQKYFNCFPSEEELSTQIKWNLTLEYYASVYARQMCVADLNIPMALHFITYKDLTYAWSKLHIFDDFYRELWNTRNYNSDANATLLDKNFLELVSKMLSCIMQTYRQA